MTNSCFAIIVACVAKVDLGLLIDGSGSINAADPSNFNKIKKFLRTMASAFVISPKATRVGAVLYSSRPKALFDFKRYKSINDVTKAISRMPYPGKGTSTGFALRYTHRYLFSSLPKKSRKRFLVVVTDGKSKDDVRIGASGLKATGVEIVVVGIGKRLSRKQLLQIASSPAHVVSANFKSLQQVVRGIKQKACRRAPKPSGKLYTWKLANTLV